MNKAENDFKKDIEDIAQIEIVPVLLDVICQTTQMGFAAIARVTDERWVTCSVKDNILFGLKPGDELEIKTTICNEIRERNKLVAINHVAEDEEYRHHHTPAMYGFQSYISVPIIRKDGTFFGTLCAIDPHPHDVKNDKVIGMFNLYADLISFHLMAIEENRRHLKTLDDQIQFNSELEAKVEERTRQLTEKNISLEKLNTELESFAYISSHDLQEPLRKIETFASLLKEKETAHLSASGKHALNRMGSAAERMRTLLDDLLSYSYALKSERKFENISLPGIIEEIKDYLQDDIEQKNVLIETGCKLEIYAIPFQIRQLMINLISNSIKFSSSERRPHILVSCDTVELAEYANETKSHYHICVKDNGIGFEEQYNDQLFNFFKKFHNNEQYAGTGFGLAIVKRIVENHNGIISAKGVPDEGAEFNIYIPKQH